MKVGFKHESDSTKSILQKIIMVFMVSSHINLLMTNVPHHTETSRSICIANQLTILEMMVNIAGH